MHPWVSISKYFRPMVARYTKKNQYNFFIGYKWNWQTFVVTWYLPKRVPTTIDIKTFLFCSSFILFQFIKWCTSWVCNHLTTLLNATKYNTSLCHMTCYELDRSTPFKHQPWHPESDTECTICTIQCFSMICKYWQKITPVCWQVHFFSALP